MEENELKRERVNNIAFSISAKKPFIYVQGASLFKQKRRVMVGIVDGSHLKIGISTCGRKDDFDFKKGFEIALNRSVESPTIAIKLKQNQNAKKLFTKYTIFMDASDLNVI